MFRDTSVILGIPIDNLTLDEAVKKVFSMIEEYRWDERPRYVATVNIDFVVNTLASKFSGNRRSELLQTLQDADMATADGMPILWTSKLLGTPLQERVTGADLVPKLAEIASLQEKKIYFLGGHEAVAKQAVEALQKSCPNLQVAGISSPVVSVEGEYDACAEREDRRIVEEINRSGADILLIAFGNPKQELWFARNRHQLRVPVSIGVGGTFDLIAGTIARAPRWMQNSGIEWIFRIMQEPGRLWKRYLIGFFKFGFFVWPVILNYRFRWFLSNLFPGKGSSDSIVGTSIVLTNSRSLRVIKLPQRLDTSMIFQVKKVMDENFDPTMDFVLDFSQVDLIDSAGLGLIVGICLHSKKMNKQVFLIKVSHSIEKFLKLNRSWDLFEEKIFVDLNEMLNQFEAKRKSSPRPFGITPWNNLFKTAGDISSVEKIWGSLI